MKKAEDRSQNSEKAFLIFLANNKDFCSQSGRDGEQL